MPEPAPSRRAFRLRSTEVTRIEAISDAVFALAATFLMLNMDPPKSFAELMHDLRGIVVAAVCFASLFLLWWEHHTFFRRYGLQDPLTFVLNAVLLFVVLVYVYPLRYLFGVVFGVGNLRETIRWEQMPLLMTVYGTGFGAISLLYAGLYANALRQRARLQLTAFEVLATRQCLWGNGWQALIASASIAVAWLGGPRAAPFAGFLYFGIGVARGLIGWHYGRLQSRT